MTTKRLYTIVLLTSLSILLAAPLCAQQNWTSPEEFRAEYLQFVDTLSARVPPTDQSSWAIGIRQKISDLRQQVNTLPFDALTQLAKSYDRETFIKMVDRLAAGNSSFQENAGTGAAPSTSLQEKAGTVQGPIQPSHFTSAMAISPPDFAGAVAGTTCSTTPTDAGTLDGEKIGLDVAIGVQVPLDYACETIVEVLGEGTNAPFCAAAAIAKAAEVILDAVLGHQEFCNSLLDGAKVDATLADVTDIHGDVVGLDTHLTNVNNQITSEFSALDTHVTNVDNHIAAEFTALDAHLVALVSQLSNQITGATDLLSAELKQVMKLELTPEGQRQIVPAILTCTGANCPNVLTMCPSAGCFWNNVGPLP